MIEVQKLLKEAIIDALGKVVIVHDPITGSSQGVFPTDVEIDAIVEEYARDIKRAVLEDFGTKDTNYRCVECGKIGTSRCDRCGSDLCLEHTKWPPMGMLCEDCFTEFKKEIL